MATRTGKLIPFPLKPRHVRGRFTSTGEFLRLLAERRPRPDDEGPNAA